MMQQSFWALAASACFAAMAAFVKLCAADLGSFELVFYRSLFGVVTIAAFELGRGQSLRTPYLTEHMVRSFLGVASVALWFYALARMPFAPCMTLIYTTPLWMALNFIVLARLRSQPAPWTMAASIAVGFVGICCILKPGLDEGALWPALICLAVALIDLLAYWQMKRMGRLNEPSWRIVFYFCVLGAVFSAVGTWVTGGFHPLQERTIWGLLAMGVCATLGQVCTTRSYAYGNMLLSSCLGFSAIAFSALLGMVLFDDALDGASWTGMALVVMAGMVASVATKRMQERF